MFSRAGDWLSKTATGLLSSVTQTARQAQQAIRTAKEYIDFLNEPANKLALTALNEAPQLLPPQHQKIITPITGQIPHTQAADGTKQLADDFKTLGDKLTKIKDAPTSQPTENKRSGQLNSGFSLLASITLLAWPKIMLNNMTVLFYFYKTSRTDYQPQLQQISQWMQPESEDKNALSHPVKLAHQSYEAFHIFLSIIEQITFLQTLASINPLLQSRNNADHQDPSFLTQLYENDALNNINILVKYSSMSLLIVNFIMLAVYFKKIYTPELAANMREFLQNGYTLFSEKIHSYMESKPWPPESHDNRSSGYRIARSLFYQNAPDEKEEPQLNDSFSEHIYTSYERIRESAPSLVAIPIAHVSTKLISWLINTQLLPLKNYLQDIPKDDLTGTFTAAMYRQAQIALCVWMLSHMIFGLIQALLERRRENYLPAIPKPDFKQQFAQQLDNQLQAICFNADEKPAAHDDESIASLAEAGMPDEIAEKLASNADYYLAWLINNLQSLRNSPNP